MKKITSLTLLIASAISLNAYADTAVVCSMVKPAQGQTVTSPWRLNISRSSSGETLSYSQALYQTTSDYGLVITAHPVSFNSLGFSDLGALKSYQLTGAGAQNCLQLINQAMNTPYGDVQWVWVTGQMAFDKNNKPSIENLQCHAGTPIAMKDQPNVLGSCKPQGPIH